MCSAPVLVDSRVFWTFVNMLLNTTSLLFATKQLVLFLPPKIWTTCPIKCFSEWCPVTIFWPSELPWCVVKCFTEGWWWYSETNEITILCSKQAQKHIRSVLSCSKNTLFHAYCIPMYACQLWSKYTQTSMKRLRVAYNNVYRIMQYIPRNVSVRQHQANHCVRTYGALFRNKYVSLFTTLRIFV